MIFHQWRQSDSTPAETRARIIAEQEAIAARKALEACPGLAYDTPELQMEPTPYRNDATAARAQALLDLMRN